MASMSTERATGARTGEQFLDGLRAGGREIWLRGEKISNPLDHPDLRSAGRGCRKNGAESDPPDFC